MDTGSRSNIRRRDEISEALTSACGQAITEFLLSREKSGKKILNLRKSGFSIRRVVLSANFADATIYWFLRQGEDDFVNPFPRTPIMDQVCNHSNPSNPSNHTLTHRSVYKCTPNTKYKIY